MKLVLLLLISVCAYGQDPNVSSDVQSNTSNHTVKVGKASVANFFNQLNTISQSTNLNGHMERLLASFIKKDKNFPLKFTNISIPKNIKKSFVLISNSEKEFRYKLPSDIFSKTTIATDEFLSEQKELFAFTIDKIQEDSLVALEYFDNNNKSTRILLNKKDTKKLVKLIALSQQSRKASLQFLFAEYMKRKF